MKETFIDKFKDHKACIFGIQGSGKTVWAKQMYKKFKKPIVYAINDDDNWKDLPRLYVWKAKRQKLKEDFDTFIKKCRTWALQGKIDLIMIDEADLFFQSNWHMNPEMQDLVLNHRHMKVAIWFITRRPQDIPTKIVESSKNQIIYKLEGDNALKKFDEIHPKLRALIEQLDYKKHNFIHKEIGEEPTIQKPLKIK